MNIECPECKKTNELLLDGTQCGNCKHDLSSLNFKSTKKSMLPTVAAIVLSAAAVHQADKKVISYLYRLPMKAEYAVLESCINADSRLIDKLEYIEKRDICLCAMEKTTKQEIIDYSEKGMREFAMRFKENTYTCGGQWQQ